MQSSPPDTRSRVDSTPTSPPSPLEVTQPDPNPFPILPEDPDFDTMPYHYPQYTDGPDAKSHIRAFVSIWQPTTQRNNSRLPKSMPRERRVHVIPRWTGCTMVFSARRRGGYHLPKLAHEVPRYFPLRGAQTRTAPTVLFHEPRIEQDGRKIHDPFRSVLGSWKTIYVLLQPVRMVTKHGSRPMTLHRAL